MISKMKVKVIIDMNIWRIATWRIQASILKDEEWALHLTLEEAHLSYLFSTKSESKAKRFQKKKFRIEQKLTDLKYDDWCHMDVLKSAAADLKEDLKDLKVEEHIYEF